MPTRSSGRRYQRRLDGIWRFAIDREEKGLERGWQNPEYSDDLWLPARVPGNWDCYKPELRGYAGIAWFRHHFNLNPAWQGKKIVLHFEGVNYITQVWLNGVLAGEHAGGYDPFDFDATGLVRWEGDNCLVVRVDNWPRNNRVPNNFMRGWFNYGGIYRSVSLLALPWVRISDVFIHPEKAVDGGDVEVDVTITNQSTQSINARIGLKITSPTQPSALLQPAQPASTHLDPGQTTQVRLRGSIAEARFWSPDDPFLYHAEISLSDGDQQVDRQTERFGIRKFELRGQQFYLNNQPIYLTGFDRHEEYAGSGRSDLRGDLRSDLRWIKHLNGNMVRMHYQGVRRMYDLADEMGLMVFAEIPLWQIGLNDIHEWEHPDVWKVSESLLRGMIGSLKNHPSVVIWSVGNENATNHPAARPLIGHLADLTRKLDSNRPVAYVGMFGPDEVVFDLVDLPCLNVYFKHDQDGLRARLDKTHALTPEKPLFITEFGAESILGLHGENVGSEEEHAAILADHWQVFQERQDYIPGAIIWSLRDYYVNGKAPDYSWSINRYMLVFGVLTIQGLPKASAKMAQQLFGSKKGS